MSVWISSAWIVPTVQILRTAGCVAGVGTGSDDRVEQTVRSIIADIRSRGDAALIDYTNRFDRMQVSSMAELEISQSQLQQAIETIPG